ncbi:MAG: DUF5610 domain-containing protein [Candidatus Hydrogenedentota bacterium]
MASTSITLNYELTAIKYQQVYEQTKYLTQDQNNEKSILARDNRLNLLPAVVNDDDDKLSIGNHYYENIHQETVYQVIQERISLTVEGNFSEEEIENVRNKFEDFVDNYFSPQAVAKRIVDFSTGFFEAYAQRGDNLPKPKNEVVDGFEKLIRGAIDEAFRQAREILGGVFEQGSLPTNIKTLIDDTYSEVQKGLKEFFDKLREELLEPNKPSEKENEMVEGSLPPQYELASTT